MTDFPYALLVGELTVANAKVMSSSSHLIFCRAARRNLIVVIRDMMAIEQNATTTAGGPWSSSVISKNGLDIFARCVGVHDRAVSRDWKSTDTCMPNA